MKQNILSKIINPIKSLLSPNSKILASDGYITLNDFKHTIDYSNENLIALSDITVCNKNMIVEPVRSPRLIRNDTFMTLGSFENDYKLVFNNTITNNGHYTLFFYAYVELVAEQPHKLMYGDRILETLPLFSKGEYGEYLCNIYIDDYSPEKKLYIDGLSLQPYFFNKLKLEKGNKSTEYNLNYRDVMRPIGNDFIFSQIIPNKVWPDIDGSNFRQVYSQTFMFWNAFYKQDDFYVLKIDGEFYQAEISDLNIYTSPDSLGLNFSKHGAYIDVWSNGSAYLTIDTTNPLIINIIENPDLQITITLHYTKR